VGRPDDLAGVSLCKAAAGGFRLKDVRPLVRDAKFICAKCGRAAAKKGNLCAPKPLNKR